MIVALTTASALFFSSADHYGHEDSGTGDKGSNGKGRRAAARTPDDFWR